MGYAHGTKWDERLIKEKILEVVEAYSLERMPSSSEVEQYFGNYQLTNAISKRMGWYKLAREMGLQIKDSESYFGKKYEQVAKEQLSAMGFEVRKMSQNFPYDLLVEDCVKIDVKASMLYKGQHGNFYSFNLEKAFCTCDIYILYLIDEAKKIKDVLIIPSKFVSTNTQISVGEKSSKYYKYSNQWRYIEEYVNFINAVL